MAVSTPWTESIDVRRRWRDEDRAAGRRGIDDRRADETHAWYEDLTGEADRYYDRCVGDDTGDPREALVQLIAVAGAAIDAMGRDGGPA